MKGGRWPWLVAGTMLSAGESLLLFVSACSFRNSSVVGKSRREPDRPIQKVQDLHERVSVHWAELPAGRFQTFPVFPKQYVSLVPEPLLKKRPAKILKNWNFSNKSFTH